VAYILNAKTIILLARIQTFFTLTLRILWIILKRYLEDSLNIDTPKRNVLRAVSMYAENLAAFQPNARLYLMNAVVLGVASGIFRLLFNFYVLSLGYNEALLGNLVTASAMTALVAALPMGYLADIIGRKTALILGGVGSVAAVGLMVLAPSVPMFIAMNMVMGLGQSLAGVTMGPFLMENSSEKERTYLFSFASGLTMGSGFMGNWLGGLLPTWLSGWLQVSATATPAYAGSLVVNVLLGTLGILPLLWIHQPRLSKENRAVFAPLTFARENPGSIGKLILPMLITSIGAGLIMPFMNVFFRQVHHQPDPAIGAMFAWSSLAMGIGLLLAPPLADRMGKIQLVVVTQALSIPFLVGLGFSPWFALSALSYYVRSALMNMSGPVYQTFVMEHVEPKSRATIASLVSMANNFGWALSPTISGWIQVRYGFGPAFFGTLILYVLSISLYWKFFWPRGDRQNLLPGQSGPGTVGVFRKD
jgi:MFS family permease